MGRKERMFQRIVDAAGVLPGDEHVEVVGVAQIGNPKGDLAASAVASVVTGALGAGPSLLGDKRYGVILTNQRMLFVEIDKDFGKVRPGIAREWQRPALRTSSPHKGWLMTSFDLHAEDRAIRLNFPRASRSEAAAINRALSRS